jgi:hypothetical protein
MPAWYHPTALTTKAAKIAKAAKVWLRKIFFALFAFFANFAVDHAEAPWRIWTRIWR